MQTGNRQWQRQWQRQLTTGNVGMAPERNFKSKRFISCEYAGTKANRMRVITHTRTDSERKRGREMTTCWPLDSLKSLSRFYFRFRLSSFFFSCTFCTVQVFQSVLKSASIAVSVFISLSGRCKGVQRGPPEVLMKAAGWQETSSHFVDHLLPCYTDIAM